MAQKISARSPFIIDINESGQTSSKLEVFVWNNPSSLPSSPTYTLSKNVPSSTNLLTSYNISPYLREKIKHTLFDALLNSTTNMNNNQWCNVQVKRYKNTSTLLNTLTYIAFDGYGYYNEGANVDLGEVLLDEGTYYYHYDSSADLIGNSLARAGNITVSTLTSYSIRYTNLVTGATQTESLSNNSQVNSYVVVDTWMSQGNKLEVLSGVTVLKTFYFKPIPECRYQPVVIDFVNKYGAWQRQFFFKASYRSQEMTNSEFNLMQTSNSNYDILEGQRKTFNTNSKETIRINSGFVDDSFYNVLLQVLNSERILLNNSPVICKTKSIEKKEQINSKMNNYEFEFIYAYDTINSVI
jgi:hypothetical protein